GGRRGRLSAPDEAPRLRADGGRRPARRPALPAEPARRGPRPRRGRARGGSQGSVGSPRPDAAGSRPPPGAARDRPGASPAAVPLGKDKALGRRMLGALAAPFAVFMLEDDRRDARVQIATRVDFRGLCADAFAAYEPNVPWNEGSLALRRECYVDTVHPLRA